MYAARSRKIETDRRDAGALAEAMVLRATAARIGRPTPSAMGEAA
jgi:hypothetical protein